MAGIGEIQIADPASIWRHVTPRWISPEQDENGAVYISIEGNCDWESEHGVHLVLLNGERWVRVSDCSGHLTDGRAWGKRSLGDWMSDPSRSLPVRSSDELLKAKE